MKTNFKYKKSFFFLPIISFLPTIVLVSCGDNLNFAQQTIKHIDSQSNASTPKIGFRLDTFEKSPLEDIENPQSQYF
ncbi:hypothetical protein [Mesomycoplasma hyorhinis]